MEVLNFRWLKGIIASFSHTVKTMTDLFLVISFTAACVKEISIEHNGSTKVIAKLCVDIRPMKIIPLEIP